MNARLEGTSALPQRRPILSPELAFRLLTAGCAALVLLVLAAMLVRTTDEAWPALREAGISFVTGRTWNPVSGELGALPLVYGTLVTSAIGVVIAVPVAILIALYLTQAAPRRLRTPLGYLVDLLAAVPSVIYGLWGFQVLAPFLSDHVWQPLSDHLGFIPLFSDFGSQLNLATAGVILALMIVPIVSAICREVFATVPAADREAALALGATRWEMIRMAVLPRARAGVIGAVMLGFGRAVGETIAVAYLVGGRADISQHLFQPGWTIASNIAVTFNEAASNPQARSALIGLGVLLFAITLVINVAARLVVWRTGRAA
jgi:phosphate transport system permease protein